MKATALRVLIADDEADIIEILEYNLLQNGYIVITARNGNEAIEKAAVMLKTGQVDMPKQKARLLMQFVLNKPRQYLIVYDKKILTKNS